MFELTKAGCTDEFSNAIVINCFGNDCACTPTLIYNHNDCELTWNLSGCSGFLVTLQKLVNSVWTDEAVNPSQPYSLTSDGIYRLKLTKTGCPDVFSNSITATCVSSCTLTIDSYELDIVDCGRVNFSWSNSSGGNVNVSFAYPSVNPTDCNTAGGWTNFTPTGLILDQVANTGTAVIDDPNACGKCIRILIDDPLCTIRDDYLVVPCCCVDTPTITPSPTTETFTARFYNPINGNDDAIGFQFNGLGVALNVVHGMRVRNSNGLIVHESQAFNTSSLIGSSCLINSTITSGLNSSVVSNIESTVKYLYLNGVQYDLEDSAYHAGVNVVDLIFDNNATGDTQSAYCTVIKNILDSLGATQFTHYYYSISVLSNRLTLIFRNANLQTTWYAFDQHGNVGVELLDTTTLNIVSSPALLGAINTPSLSYVTECGSAVNIRANNVPINTFVSSNTNVNLIEGNKLNTAFTIDNYPIDYNIDLNPTSNQDTSCAATELTVTGECSPGATYLWSTGETTESIIVISGNYSVIVTCPDGCSYNLNINV